MIKNNEELEILRDQISKIDDSIALLISKRFEVVKEIGKLKKRLQLPILDSNREGEVFKRLTKNAKKLKVNPDLLRDMWIIMMDYSKKEQK